MVASIPLAVIFGNKFENIKSIIIVAAIGIVAISLIYQESTSPISFANNPNSTDLQNYITSINNFIIWAFGFIPSLVFSSIGTTMGIMIGKIIKAFSGSSNNY